MDNPNGKEVVLKKKNLKCSFLWVQQNI